MVSIGPSISENDVFIRKLTNFIAKPFYYYIRQRIGLGTMIDEESDLRSYNNSSTNKATTIIITIIYLVLPIVTILVLY
jgi:hypothetical protein